MLANDPPRGIYPARLDEKGRLKLPTVFRDYLIQFPEQRFFITSLDLRTARIYPIAVWRENERLFESALENPELPNSVAFCAMDLGAEAELDPQGRIPFPLELLRQLGIQDSKVRLYAYRGHLEVLSEAVYEELRRKASEAAERQLRNLERSGLR